MFVYSNIIKTGFLLYTFSKAILLTKLNYIIYNKEILAII